MDKGWNKDKSVELLAGYKDMEQYLHMKLEVLGILLKDCRSMQKMSLFCVYDQNDDVSDDYPAKRKK